MIDPTGSARVEARLNPSEKAFGRILKSKCYLTMSVKEF